MSLALRDTLRRLELERKAEALGAGSGEPALVFCNANGNALD